MNNLRSTLQSSKAAIDLASIMVGIIVIGLIGGVIAATVFAVIPWAQDNAAKQQLDSVHSAQNAFFGLSADPSQDLVGGKKNSFANSAELASNNLLVSNANYCTVPTADGQDYRAYSKSGSGKTYYSLNSNKQAKVFTGSYPCVADANGIVGVNPVIDNGTTPVGTAPGSSSGGTGGGTTPTTPEPTTPSHFAVYDFEGTAAPAAYASQSTVSNNTLKAYNGTKAARVSSNSDNATNYGFTQNTPLVKGTVYTASVWVYAYDSSIQKINIIHDTKIIGSVSTVGKTGQWIQIPASQFTANTTTISVVGEKSGTAAGTILFFADDLTIDTK